MPVTPLNSGFLHKNDPERPRVDANVSFREIVPGKDHPRIAGIEHHTAQSWCASRRQVDAPAWLINKLDKKNMEKPYVGFSSNGKPDPSFYHYEEDEGAPVEQVCNAVNSLLDILNPEHRDIVVFGDVREDEEFRIWSNPELYVNQGGLRLDEQDENTRTHILNILEASLSKKGYEKTIGCTLTNHFLGELVNGPQVLNMHSYNFRLFLPATKKPSARQPWGYTFFGHHLCLNVAFCGKSMVIGPTFMGAEPDRIDKGPHKGLRLFREEETKGLQLMQSLSSQNQKLAQLCEGMDTKSGLSADRWNPFDERHLGGARQDNRVVPYEGCYITNFTKNQREVVYEIIETFNSYLPSGPLAHRMNLVRRYEKDTCFSWIGKFGPDDPYYYRIHSPVTFCEFDFHCGIFLTNTSPAKCHIHTINRLPNLGDYGKAMFRNFDRRS